MTSDPEIKHRSYFASGSKVPYLLYRNIGTRRQPSPGDLPSIRTYSPFLFRIQTGQSSKLAEKIKVVDVL